MTTNQLSRRRFLQGMGLAATSVVLAACAPPAAPQSTSSSGAPAAETPEIWLALTNPCPAGGNPDITNGVQQYVLDQTGILVNTNILPPGGAATEKLNLMLASGSQALDLFTGNWPDFKGITLPLDELLEQHGTDILAGHSDLDWKMMKDFEGTTWGYPRLGLMGHTHFPFFRSDWLAEAGLNQPETWDEMEAAFTAMKANHPDAVIAGMGRTNTMMNTLGAFTEHGFSRWIDPADDMLKPAELQPGYEEWLAKMNEWYSNGWLLQEDYASPDYRAVLKTLNVGVWLGWYSRMTIWWDQIRRDAGYETEDYALSLRLTGPMGLSKTNNAGSNSAYMIPRKSKHPDAVIRYVNWSYEGRGEDVTNYLVTWWGVPGKDWEWVDKENKIARLITAQNTACEEKYSGDYNIALGLGPELWATAVKQELPDGSIEWNRHQQHIYTYTHQLDNGKLPVDYDVPYDRSLIRDNFAGEADFDRVMEEESIKFITGARPMSEWGDFQAQLEQAGLDKWSEQYTQQYRLYHPA